MSERSEKRVPYQPLSHYPPSPPPLQQPVAFMAAPTGHQACIFQSTAINGKPMVYSPMMMVMAYPPQPQVAIQVTQPHQIVTPSTHLILTVILFIVLTLFSPETLFFMIPALILSILSHRANKTGQYVRAKRFGTGALILNFISLIVAFIVSCLVVGLSLGLKRWHRAQDYFYPYYGCWYVYDYFDGSGQPPMICT